jgi:hypothetical protein
MIVVEAGIILFYIVTIEKKIKKFNLADKNTLYIGFIKA